MIDSAADKNPTSRRAKKAALELEPAVKEEWVKFPNLPGTHLSIHRVGRSLELVDKDRSVWASCDNRSFTNTKSAVHAGDRTYKWLQVSRERKSHMAWKAIGAIIKRPDDSRDLVDAGTGELVLQVTGYHFSRRANTYVTLPDQTTITLPVRGLSPKTAIMSAIDDSGGTLVECRLNYSSRKSQVFANPNVFVNSNDVVEIVVSPTGLSIPTIDLVVAVTYECLGSYFDSGGSF